MNKHSAYQVHFKRSRRIFHRAVLFFTLCLTIGLVELRLANAEALGELSLHLATDRAEDTNASGGTATSERHFRLNLATGWLTPVSDTDSLGYGLSFRADRGLQAGSDLAGYGVGVFLAWYNGPLSFRIDYIALAELKSNNAIVETAFSQGSGLAFQARWLHWQTKQFAFGPSLAFEQIKYAKSRVGTLPETSASRTTESLMPGIASVFLF